MPYSNNAQEDNRLRLKAGKDAFWAGVRGLDAREAGGCAVTTRTRYGEERRNTA